MFTKAQEQYAVAVPAEVRRRAASVFMAKCFSWMTIGLGLTALVAFAVAVTGLSAYMSRTMLYVMMFAELGIVLWLSFGIKKMSATTATGAFIGYAVLNGVVFGVILQAFTGATIAGAFFVASGMFAATAVYGMVTRRDLTNFGSFMFMGLVGLIIASVVNIFLASSALEWAINYLGVIVFLGLTVYDSWKIKQIGEQGIMEMGDEAIRKGAIMGALALYLDFINLFLFLLRILGGNRN